MGRMIAPHFFSSRLVDLTRTGQVHQAYALLVENWTRTFKKLKNIPVEHREILAWLCQINNDLPKAASLYAIIPSEHRTPDLILNQATLYFNAERIEEGLRILREEMPEFYRTGWQYFNNLLGALYRNSNVEGFKEEFKRFYSRIGDFTSEDLGKMLPTIKLCDKIDDALALLAWKEIERRNVQSLNQARILRELNLGRIDTAEILLQTLDVSTIDLKILNALSALRSGVPEESVRLLLELEPDQQSELAVLTLAQAQLDLGNIVEARQSLSRVNVELNIKARALLASLEIYSGNLDLGFHLMSLSQTDELLLHKYGTPSATRRWSGDKNSNLILLGDQGLGDQIIFGSCLDDLILEHLGKIFLLTDERLCQLFNRTFPELKGVFSHYRQIQTVGEGKWAYERLSRLTAKYRKSFTQFPGRGYQRRKLMAGDESPVLVNVDAQRECVGISWKTTRLINKAKRDANLSQWIDLLRDYPVKIINLQYETSDDEWSTLRECTNLIEHDIDLKQDIAGVAQLMTRCDLVLTIGNTNAYLAGALGVKTLVVLPVSPRDLWFGEGEASPWFSQVYLLRDPSPLALTRAVCKLLG